jgi:hypothetical protein
MANVVGEMEAQHPPRKRTMVLESQSCVAIDEYKQLSSEGGVRTSIVNMQD